MFHQGDICKNVYTSALQRSILKNQNSVKSDCVYIILAYKCFVTNAKGGDC